MTTGDSKHKIVRLNVGGTRYEVSRDTLERSQGSMLSNLISDKWKEGNSSEDSIFIDRNGHLFQYVLDYLRTDNVYLPPSVSQAAVKQEFEYFGIDADMTKVSEKYSSGYNVALIKKSIALHTEKLAIRAAALAEIEFLKSESNCSIFNIVLPYDEYAPIETQHTLMGDCFLARGLKYSSGRRGSEYNQGSPHYPLPNNAFNIVFNKVA